jgi:hypothetical protein
MPSPVPFLNRWLPVIALAITLVAVIDPLEGFPLVLMGGALTTMAAVQERSRWLRLAVRGLVLAAAGAAAMLVLSAMGGVGSGTGRSAWWLLGVMPYPAGVALFVAANLLLLRDRSASAAP